MDIEIIWLRKQTTRVSQPTTYISQLQIPKALFLWPKKFKKTHSFDKIRHRSKGYYFQDRLGKELKMNNSNDLDENTRRVLDQFENFEVKKTGRIHDRVQENTGMSLFSILEAIGKLITLGFLFERRGYYIRSDKQPEDKK